MIHKIFTNNALMVLLLAAVLIVASALLLNWVFQPTMDRIEWQETTYRVQAGDSLWSISRDYCPNSVDRREWIDEVRSINGMTSSNIRPGQKLTVLAPVK